MSRVVRTRHGRVEGDEHGGIQVFRGIPYAAPPVDHLRFRPPEPPDAWRGVRMTRRFGGAAPQLGPANRLIRTLISAAGSTQSQDCLYLNVWTPAADSRRRPVLVWLHGGAFILGSGGTRLYSGLQLAKRGDVVVVTVNYRLGALGYLSWRAIAGDEEAPPANLGLRDQIAALEWVRDNIEGFGGDPENVTLFGESAGAMSVGTLLGTPRARGLFHKAILQSGATANVSSREHADEVAEEFARALGPERSSPGAIAALPVSDIMRAQAITTVRQGIVVGNLAWQPCLDDDLLREWPIDAIAGGLSADVPVLIGTNRDEWKLFMTGDPKGLTMSEEALLRRFRRALPSETEAGERHSEVAIEAYARVPGRLGTSPSERWSAFQSDRLFHDPATQLAEAHATNGGQTYAYLFEWVPPLMADRLGACHGLDLPFVFGTLREPWLRTWLGASGKAQRLCNQIQDAWVAFARNGSPEHDRLPDWPAYTTEHRATMALSTFCSLRLDPHVRGRACWETIGRGVRSSLWRRTREKDIDDLPESKHASRGHAPA
jgi:para-nitrobenzyl esterase